jgi:hypothetical protein
VGVVGLRPGAAVPAVAGLAAVVAAGVVREAAREAAVVGRRSVARPFPPREEELVWRCPGLEVVDRLDAVLRRAAAVLRDAGGTRRGAGSTPMVIPGVPRSQPSALGATITMTILITTALIVGRYASCVAAIDVCGFANSSRGDPAFAEPSSRDAPDWWPSYQRCFSQADRYALYGFQRCGNMRALGSTPSCLRRGLDHKVTDLRWICTELDDICTAARC